MAPLKSFGVIGYNTFLLDKILNIYKIASESETNPFFKSFGVYYMLILLLLYNLSGTIFVIINLSDLIVALRAVVFILGGVEAVGMFYCYAVKASDVVIVHTKLQEIVDDIVKSM